VTPIAAAEAAAPISIFRRDRSVMFHFLSLSSDYLVLLTIVSIIEKTYGFKTESERWSARCKSAALGDDSNSMAPLKIVK
jgi:hypothetical protein